MIFQRLAGDVFHHQEGNTVFVDSDVVQLDDGRIGKLADDLGLAEELLLEVLTEVVKKGFKGDGSADNVVARLIDAARGPGPEVSEGFVPALWQGNHAERRRREARSRRPLPLVCGGACGITLVRARG